MGAENLGVEWLSASLKRVGIDTELVFDPALFDDLNSVSFPNIAKAFSITRELPERIVRGDVDLIGISLMTNNFLWGMQLARRVKEIREDIPIVVGGIHPTLVPEYVIKEKAVDYVLVGEAERSLVELAGALKERREDDLRNIAGLYYKRGEGAVMTGGSPELIEDLDSLPFPDKEIFVPYYKIRGETYRTIASRGCPYRCSYCCHSYLHNIVKGRYVRRRSVENMIAELSEAKRRFAPSSVHFNDDIFTLNRKWTLAFLGRYKREIGLPFVCITHPKFIDEEVARALKESGCYRVKIGVQSLDEKTKREVIDRRETNEEVIRCFEIMDKIRLPFSTDHIFGLPGEKVEHLEKAAEIYVRFNELKMINTYWLTLYPKTTIIEKAERLGALPLSRAEIERRISSGEIGTYLAGGTVFAEERRRFYAGMELLFAAIGALPKPIAKKLIKRGFRQILFLLPLDTRVLLYFISIIRFKDAAWLSYIKWYLRNIISISQKRLWERVIDTIRYR